MRVQTGHLLRVRNVEEYHMLIGCDADVFDTCEKFEMLCSESAIIGFRWVNIPFDYDYDL